MPGHYDFKKEWEKTRAQLTKFSAEAAKVAKKGEVELIKFSRLSKMHVDATAISLKKEKLYYMIGKEYMQAKDLEGESPKLAKLVTELKKANQEQSALKRKLKTVKK
jgi:hypothetical protein